MMTAAQKDEALKLRKAGWTYKRLGSKCGAPYDGVRDALIRHEAKREREKLEVASRLVKLRKPYRVRMRPGNKLVDRAEALRRCQTP